MVTYSFRLTTIQVRFLAPHPFLFILLGFVLCCGRGSAAEVGNIDYYAAAPDTLVVVAASSDSLVRVVGGDIFGVYWSSFGGNGQITSIDGVSMNNRADGVQELATATYSTFKGVEAAIANVAATDPLVLQWLEQIYDQLYSSSRSGDEVTKTSVADLISDLLGQFSGDWSYSVPHFVSSAGISNGRPLFATQGFSGSGFLSLFTSFFENYFTFFRSNWDYLYLSFQDQLYCLWPTLLSSGSSGSLANATISHLTSEGFLGLATLLSGSDDHRGNWVWLNQSGYEGNGNTSLMDMVGEGFLGLSSLLTDAEPGEVRLSWMYVSPDDGLSGQQINHSTLFSFLGSFASGVQNPLARLAYVLADLDDVVLKQQEKPNMDAVKDSFFGDGEAAVDPNQIKDVAGAASSFKGAFSSPVSIADFFSALSDGQNYVFFSKETADNLDRVNAAAVVSDVDPYDGYVKGEDGLYYPSSPSMFDLYSYLEGLS